MERWVKVVATVQIEHRGLTELSDEEIRAEFEGMKFDHLNDGSPDALVKANVVNVKIEDDEPTDEERTALNHKARFGFGR